MKHFSLSRFLNLLYKNKCFRKMKSILTFSKWTKKMSKIGKPKKSLLTEFFYYDIENLSSQTKLKKIFCDCKNLKIFFIKIL